MNSAKYFFCIVAPLLLVGLLSGCASNAPAPVIDRTVQGSLQGELGRSAVAAEPLGPDMYVVKKGDTLRAIALDHGQSYRDLAAWNGLSDPNRIEVGQALRVAPPGAPIASVDPVAVAKPVNMAGGVEPSAVAVAGGATHVATAGTEESIKRAPKGGKQPYTPEALEKMQKSEQAPPAGSTVPPVLAAVASSPATLAANPAPAGTTGAAVKSTDETVDWAWPGAGKLVAGFVEDKNKGIDLVGKIGDPVLAAAAGKVILVSNALRGYGNFVIIKHNNAFLSVYAHNSRILVKEEQSVSRGQKIAEVGNSDTDQPKLHFEIRRQGKPVDPTKFLPVR
jgi:lipoprotein NlpD